MDSIPLPVWLAFMSLIFGVVATIIFIYVVLPRRRQARARQDTSPLQQTPAKAPAPASPPKPAAAPASAKVRQHSLFVIFSHPDATTDERLTEWLRGKNARFDALKKVFLIDGQQRSNPITLANAFPPGEMPDLLSGEKHAPIRGISLLVKPPIHKRRNQQMHVYVALAKEMNDAFRGEVLDSERTPATDVTYQQIIG
ncbi:cell division protein ZipA C-terminal FtsZ-binding domain-containing protein [Vreelandella sp. EE22]